jgi:UDP-N-acetylmuramyl tripeptide synthase
MNRALGTTIGKTVQQLLQRFNNRGQALPGLIVERLQPSYLGDMLGQLPEGVVFVMGTNGKTTTTKIISELLKAAGKRVITNGSGSNLTRGVISGVLEHATWSGGLPYDIGVFEVDEAYAQKLLLQIRPQWVLALNVTRDQLDRFGEVDTVAGLLEKTMEAATEGVVTNASDPYLADIGNRLAAKQLSVDYFGAHHFLSKHFPHEKMIASVEQTDEADAERPAPQVELTSFQGRKAAYTIDGKQHETQLNLVDPHNYLNAAAALALARRLLPDVPTETLLSNLAKITPAFGRGEIFKLPDGGLVQLTLVKNPASFFQALTSFRSRGCDVMIAINDNYADSRDVSWLWDVDFLPLKGKRHIITSGKRAADMALRLQYDGIPAEAIPNLEKALQAFCRNENRKVIFATYTAMLHLYDVLKKRAVEVTS